VGESRERKGTGGQGQGRETSGGERARTMKPGGGGRELSAWVRKGPWTAEEDEVLRRHVRQNGPREWSSIRSKGLLPRTGKSCRLRWVNKLRPDIKK